MWQLYDQYTIIITWQIPDQHVTNTWPVSDWTRLLYGVSSDVCPQFYTVQTFTAQIYRNMRRLLRKIITVPCKYVSARNSNEVSSFVILEQFAAAWTKHGYTVARILNFFKVMNTN